MANEENLIPNNMRSPTEVRENGRKGGIASGKTRSLQASLRKILAMPLKDGDLDEDINCLMDFNKKNPTAGEAAIASVLNRVLKKGDPAAMKVLATILGEYDNHQTIKFEDDGFIEALDQTPVDESDIDE